MKKTYLIYLYYKLYWFLTKLINKPISEQQNKTDLTIGITTFKARKRQVKDLISRMKFIDKNINIVIAINGDYNESEQLRYLEEIKKYCNRFINIKIIEYIKPEGLSKLWNQIIINSKSDRILLLNDDVLFKKDFLIRLIQENVFKSEIALIDNSFSHFIINKTIIHKVGWFDERFDEIGGEDDDYHVRCELLSIKIERYNLFILKNHKPKLKINSYGKIIADQKSGYSNKNSEFLFKKWDISNKPFPEAAYIEKSMGNYWRIKPGMETPKFYNT